MKLLEIGVETNGEAAEAVSAVFNRFSRSGTVIEEVWPQAAQPPVVRVKTFLSAERSCVLPQIEEALWHLGQIYPLPLPSVRWLSEADWAEAWKSSYKVQHIGQRIVIKPAWLSYTAAPGQVVIELDPGLAFGTGLHPSTRLSLEALENQVQPGNHVLDVGTGSGILAIAAAKLGAGSVVALDIDGLALEVARDNIARNGVQGFISLQRASLCAPSMLDCAEGPVGIFNAQGTWNGAFNLLLMNILADVIIKSAGAIATVLAIGGLFIVSGIIESQEEAVRQALLAARLTVARRRGKKDWVALIGRKESGQSASA